MKKHSHLVGRCAKVETTRPGAEWRSYRPGRVRWWFFWIRIPSRLALLIARILN